MRAGKIDTQVSIQKPPDAGGTQDRFGQPTGDWDDVFTGVWCRIGWHRGIEDISGDRQIAVTIYVVTLRYRPGIDTTQRIKWVQQSGKVKYLSIQSVVQPRVRTGEMELECVESQR